MIIDGHVHTRGHESADAILRAIDSVGLDGVCLISPPDLTNAAEQRRALEWMARVVATDLARLLGFYWLNPLLPEAPEIVREAATTPGIRAFKLMPDHWYPHDERLVPVLDAIEETGKPILFHAGILWSHMDSSRFCRPAGFEVMLHYPKTRFALAHMAWPWIDECFAVAARMKDGIRQLTGDANTMYVDLSPGTPPEIREEAFSRALLLGETDRLIYGSDDNEPESLEKAGRILASDRDIFREKIGIGTEPLEGIMGRNLLTFIGLES